MTDPNYEKHTPSTDALDTLGTKIDEREKRDAIHLAVEPVIAGENLRPGQHVVLDIVTDEATGVEVGKGVGIVDPFLTEDLLPGERFWLVVYPREIHSLRHVWEHPAFADSGYAMMGAAAVPDFEQQEKDEAEKWLREFAENNLYLTDEDNGYGYTFKRFIDAAVDADDEYLHISGTDAHGEIPDEFWDKLEKFTGEKQSNRANWFSCSC